MKRKVIDLYRYKGYNSKIRKIFKDSVLLAIINSLILPLLLYIMVDKAIMVYNEKSIMIVGVIYILVTLLGFVLDTYSYNKMMVINNGLTAGLRHEISKKLQNIKLENLEGKSSGDMLELFLNDAMNAAYLFTYCYKDLILNLLRIIVYLGIMLYINIPITILLLSVYGIEKVISLRYIDKLQKYFADNRDKRVDFFTYLNESINCFQLVKAGGNEKEREEQLEKLLDKSFEVSWEMDKVAIKNGQTNASISFLVTAVLIFFCGMYMEAGLMTYAAFTLLMSSLDGVKGNVSGLFGQISAIKSKTFVFNKVLDFVEETKVEEMEGLDLNEVKKIEFKNVNFGYVEGQTVLKDFNLKINSMDKVALIGKTGCGKSTMVKLIPRFYKPRSGEILVNGIDISNYNLNSLRKQIAYVMQSVVIINGTILENINYSNEDISKEDIIKICKKIHLHERIMKLPDGYETHITQNHEILSTGEKQLLNFARVMVKDPQILILDEITASLSCESEELIINAMEEISKGRISILIAHRMATIEGCNKVVSMENGRVTNLEIKNV